MINLRKVLSENIKKYRSIKSLSQEELAFRCGLHRTYISDIERCSRNVSIDNIEKISKALDVSASDLFREDK
jgi:transcriptional regulator with XRE-family HTH domain